MEDIKMQEKLFSAMRVYTTLSIKPDWRNFYDDDQKILKLFSSFGVTFSLREANIFFKDCHANLAAYLIVRAQERYDAFLKPIQRFRRIVCWIAVLIGLVALFVEGLIAYILMAVPVGLLLGLIIDKERPEDRDVFVKRMFRAGLVHCLFPSSNEAFRCPSYLLMGDIWDDSFFPEFPESRKYWQSKLGLA
ncbi:MAG: hypothetical protein WC159_05500 [Sphaerochaetaceae bacterium]